MRIVLAGDREISVRVLDFIHARNVKLSGLCVSKGKKSSHAYELVKRCGYLSSREIIVGKLFREKQGLELLSELNPDYIIGVHFPYIIPKPVLAIPRLGVLNLHPAYLPYNRGWHTPSWSILEGTPYGATLHFMDEGIDTGDIVHQKEIKINIDDTAHSLYQRVLQAEYSVFTDCWSDIINESLKRKPQISNKGTAHKPDELLSPQVQMINLNSTIKVKEIFDRLRALSTNDISEAAYFIHDGKKYRVRIDIQPE